MSPCDELLRLAPPWMPSVLTIILLVYNTWISYKARQGVDRINGHAEGR